MTAAHATAQDFARTLHTRGGAVLDLSGDPTVLALCDVAIAEAKPYADAGWNRVQDLWRRGPAVRALAGLKPITDALAEAYGREPFPFQTLNFHYGSQQRAHSDTIHFTPDPAHLMCGVWLALEDVSPDAGPVEYYPGSHTLPVLSLADAGAPADMTAQEAYVRYYEPAVAARVAHITPEPALLRKGQAFVWAANLVHRGSARRHPSATRRSLVTHYFFADSQYYTLMGSRADRRAVRLPSDARTGRFMWPRMRPGDRLRTRTLAAAAVYRAARHVFRFKG
ncbi:MAG: phytanoyl-CoA dioxygenase family protein [Hyphomonadaceae bacterium]